jgi:hypothetical protein
MCTWVRCLCTHKSCVAPACILLHECAIVKCAPPTDMCARTHNAFRGHSDATANAAILASSPTTDRQPTPSLTLASQPRCCERSRGQQATSTLTAIKICARLSLASHATAMGREPQAVAMGSGVAACPGVAVDNLVELDDLDDETILAAVANRWVCASKHVCAAEHHAHNAQSFSLSCARTRLHACRLPFQRQGHTYRRGACHHGDTDTGCVRACTHHTLVSLNAPHATSSFAFRFRMDQIYTYVGDMLLAVNPYKSLGIYHEDAMARWAGHS